MTSNHLLAAIAAAAVLASGAASARQEHVEKEAGDRHASRAAPALQAVPNMSRPDQASYGWQYYTDSRTASAVVISPAGEYFLSRGDGPRQITGPAGWPLAAQPQAN